MGTAMGSGPNRALEAAQAAMASPLLEEGAIDGARGILINISGSSSLKLSEVNEASSLIQNAADEEANIIFGAVLDESMGDQVKITVIATGFREDMPERRARMLTVSNEQAAPSVRVEMQPPPALFASGVVTQPPVSEEPITEAVENLASVQEQPSAESYTPSFEAVPVGQERTMPPVVVTTNILPADAPAISAQDAVVSQSNMFAAGVAEENGHDNLDIPAFMRRGL
jgi:cell division protein FtsZ